MKSPLPCVFSISQTAWVDCIINGWLDHPLNFENTTHLAQEGLPTDHCLLTYLVWRLCPRRFRTNATYAGWDTVNLKKHHLIGTAYGYVSLPGILPIIELCDRESPQSIKEVLKLIHLNHRCLNELSPRLKIKLQQHTKGLFND